MIKNPGVTEFSRCITGFLVEYLNGERGLSPRTTASYANTIKLLVLYVIDIEGVAIDRISLVDISADCIRGFLDNMEEKGAGPATRNQRLSAVKSFVRYAIRREPSFMLEGQRILAISTKRSPVHEIVFLEQEALAALFAAPDQSTVRGRRDIAVMVLLYDTGARVQELLDLTFEDIKLAYPAIVTLTGKGNKTRTVPLMEETAEIMARYFDDQGANQNGEWSSVRLFRSAGRSQYTRPGIAKLLTRNLEKARSKDCNSSVRFPSHIHPHALRATKAIHLLEAGINLIVIRDLLGHVSVSTTQAYLRVNTKLKMEAMTKAYPSLVKSTAPKWKEDNDLMSFLMEMCASK